MIGILGAFVLNNWNEARKVEQEKQDLIASLIEDFEYNKKALSEAKIPLSEKRKAYMDNYYRLLNSEEQFVEMDSLRDLAVIFFQTERLKNLLISNELIWHHEPQDSLIGSTNDLHPLPRNCVFQSYCRD